MDSSHRSLLPMRVLPVLPAALFLGSLHCNVLLDSHVDEAPTHPISPDYCHAKSILSTVIRFEQFSTLVEGYLVVAEKLAKLMAMVAVSLLHNTKDKYSLVWLVLQYRYHLFYGRCYESWSCAFRFCGRCVCSSAPWRLGRWKLLHHQERTGVVVWFIPLQ